MKKILIIARYFGTRIPGLMKYLPEYGWQPVLITPSPSTGERFPPELRINPTPYHDTLRFWKRLFRLNPDEDLRTGIKKRVGAGSKNTIMDSLLTWAGAIVNYPDSDKGWRTYAFKAADELLQKEKFDAIISSSSPVTAHVIACELKKRHRIPWIADLRDLWSQNHNYNYGPVRRWFDKRLELKTLGAADSLVTVSQPWADNLKALHPGKTTYAVTNGFDPDLLNRPGAALTKKMTITYTGLIYRGKQYPERLLEALKALIDEGDIEPEKVEVRFYGNIGDWIDSEAAKFQLQGVVKNYGSVSRGDSVQKQRESHILLLLNWDDPGEKGTIPSKIFEYMATMRPILAVGGAADDAVQQILSESKSGYHVNTAGEIQEHIKRWYSEYMSSGKVEATDNEKAITRYSQREMAKQFSEVMARPTGPVN